jgi:acetyltransferase-like isoleucine patch superfamily enzyme
MEAGIEPYLLKVGDRVVIERGVGCITHDGAAWVFRRLVPDLQVFGPIVLEDDCYIGVGAILCPGIRVGRNAVVMAGALVISDVPPDTAVMGIPARPCSLSRELAFPQCNRTEKVTTPGR